MGLLQNGFRDKIDVFRIYGATASNGSCPQALVGNYHLTGMQRNLTAGEGITSDQVGIPMGHLAPSSWVMPQKSGAMTSFTSTKGVGTGTGTLAAGRGIAGASEGIGQAEAQGSSLAWGQASAQGMSSLSGYLMAVAVMGGAATGSTTVGGLLFALVNISGSSYGFSDLAVNGSLAASVVGLSEGSSSVDGSMSALLGMSGAAEGMSLSEGIITGCYFITGTADGSSTSDAGNMEAFGWASAIASGGSTVSMTPYAKGFMSGSTDISTGELTADGIATAVWSYER